MKTAELKMAKFLLKKVDKEYPSPQCHHIITKWLQQEHKENSNVYNDKRR